MRYLVYGLFKLKFKTGSMQQIVFRLREHLVYELLKLKFTTDSMQQIT